MSRLPSANQNKRFLISFEQLRFIVFSILLVLRSCSYEHRNRAGSVTGPNVVPAHWGNFSPVELDAVRETKPKWWIINLHRLGLLYGFVDCFTFTTTSAVETHSRHCKSFTISATMLR